MLSGVRHLSPPDERLLLQGPWKVTWVTGGVWRDVSVCWIWPRSCCGGPAVWCLWFWPVCSPCSLWQMGFPAPHMWDVFQVATQAFFVAQLLAVSWFFPGLECCTPLIFLHILCTAWPRILRFRNARPQLREGIEQTEVEVEAILTSPSSGVAHWGWMMYITCKF